jgi:hypothetical protein
MTIILPTLSWISSPNFSSRGGQKVRLCVVHDCEGNYAGSVSWFAQARSQVSAHIVLDADGSRATQMVAFANKAWHVVSFNPISEGIEAAGFAAKGLGAAEWQALANITAFRLRANGLPPVWAKGGSGQGFCQHLDLGQAGGGHHDIASDPAVWAAFIAMVQEAYLQPMPASWDMNSPAAPVPAVPAGWTPHGDPRHDLTPGSMEWVQAALNRLGIPVYPLSVDGMEGIATKHAIVKFQVAHALHVDGVAGPQTIAALEAASA